MSATGKIGSHRIARKHRRLWLAFVLAVAALIGRSAAASVPGTELGVPDCRVVSAATAIEFITGSACPPEGFADALGYQPVLVETAYGWRYTRPASAEGGCSGPLGDTGPFWNFADACRAHDYDLVRMGTGDRAAADALLYRDMMQSCESRGAVAIPACKTFAESAHAVLRIGDATGFDPVPVAQA
jgi:hypothetical protein